MLLDWSAAAVTPKGISPASRRSPFPATMLAESILTRIAYKDELRKSHKCRVLKSVADESWQNKLVDADANKDLHEESAKQAVEKTTVLRCERKVGQDVSQWTLEQKLPMKGCKCDDSPPLAPLGIPRRGQCCDQELDLYRSWSCQSLYQNYPDLHIGGDHIADHTCDSGCVMDQTYDEPSDGPILLSEDILLGQSPLSEPLKALKLWNGDEAGERSMTLHKEPLSNSVINNYMETKIQELYKQFLEEKLTRCSSVTHLLMNNIGEVSFPLLHEQHAGPSKATQTLLHSLARLGLQNASNGNSSEFSTPNLQVSK